MTHTFEIKEDSSREYRKTPFMIVNEKGIQVSYHFATREEAQAEIDRMTRPVVIPELPGLDEALDAHEGKGLLNESYDQQKESEDEIEVVSQGPETPGNVIEFHGDTWTVISSRYISAKEAEEIEEMHDVSPTPGWHHVIRKVKPLEARPSFSPGDAYIESGIERHLAWQERMREEARKRLAASKFVGKEIDYQEYPYLSAVGTIRELRYTDPQTGSIWRLCIETPARQGFEAFESPIQQWFTVSEEIIHEALNTFSVGEKVRVFFYNADDIARIEEVEE